MVYVYKQLPFMLEAILAEAGEFELEAFFATSVLQSR
jgi:hypothetical protein